MESANTKLKAICGLKVIDVALSVGDAGFSFENGTSLAIYNNFELVGLDANDAKKLIGKTVTDVVESKDTVTIKFENKSAIHVDMRDVAYYSPEAMQLRVQGEPIVVWN